MTRISKILVIFVTASSAGFMAFAIVNVLAGGPNFRAYANRIPEVTFSQDNPQAPWQVKRKTNSEDMGNGRILPEAVINAHKKLAQQENDSSAAVDKNISALKARYDEAAKLIELDTKALTVRQTELDAEYKALLAELETTSQDYNRQTQAIQQKLDTAQLRREENLQLKSQLEELRAQRLASVNELARLRDLLFQAQANLQRAQRRQELLIADGVPVANYEEEEKPAEAVPEKTPAVDAPKEEPKADEKPKENPPQDEAPKAEDKPAEEEPKS